MGTTYGYCRISTSEQNLQRQVTNIQNSYPDAVLVKESYSGRRMDRPKWTRLFKTVKDGDTIVFDEVSRMSRDAEAGYEAYKELYDRGVNLVFLKEPHLNTDVYKGVLKSQIAMTGEDIDLILKGVNQYLLKLAEKQIMLAFQQSQSEVDYLRTRTKEGMKTAREAGKQIGGVPGKKLHVKKAVEAKAKIRERSRTFDGNLPDDEVMAICKISRNTYYKYKKELLEELMAESSEAAAV